jgi:hypothetical protein
VCCVGLCVSVADTDGPHPPPLSSSPRLLLLLSCACRVLRCTADYSAIEQVTDHVLSFNALDDMRSFLISLMGSGPDTRALCDELGARIESIAINAAAPALVSEGGAGRSRTPPRANTTAGDDHKLRALRPKNSEGGGGGARDRTPPAAARAEADRAAAAAAAAAEQDDDGGLSASALPKQDMGRVRITYKAAKPRGGVKAAADAAAGPKGTRTHTHTVESCAPPFAPLPALRSWTVLFCAVLCSAQSGTRVIAAV